MSGRFSVLVHGAQHRLPPVGHLELGQDAAHVVADRHPGVATIPISELNPLPTFDATVTLSRVGFPRPRL
jgi:hypothetical protein